jgi:hypothetical protein
LEKLLYNKEKKMTTSIPAWSRVVVGTEPGVVAFALCLDGVVQQVMRTNVQTAALLLENPQFIVCKDDAEPGQTAEEAAL